MGKEHDMGVEGHQGFVLIMSLMTKKIKTTENIAGRSAAGPRSLTTLNTERRALKRGLSNTRSTERTFDVVVHRFAAHNDLWLSSSGTRSSVGEVLPSPRMLNEITHFLTLQE